MAKFLHNTQQRAFYFPAWQKLNPTTGQVDIIKDQILIGPGESAEVEQEHFDAVREGNVPLIALLDGRYLVYGDQPGDERIQLQTHSIQAPADLVEQKDERVKRETKKVETTEIDLNADDEPAESPRSRRKA